MQQARKTLFVTASFVLVSVVVAGIYGCRTWATIDYGEAIPTEIQISSPVDGEDDQSIEEPSADSVRTSEIEYSARESGILVGPLTEAGSLSANSFWPESRRKDIFLVQDAGEDEPISVMRMMQFTEDNVLEVIRSAQQGSADDEPSESDSGGVNSRTVLARSDSGEVVVLDNAASKIESTFDPAMLFLPKTLSAGETIERPFTVDAKGPRFGTGIGEGTVTVLGVGMQSVRTPGGDYDAFLVVSESSFQIGPAKIERSRHAWVVPDGGLGIVAEESSQKVKVFGISFSNKSWVSVLSEDAEESAIP